jgi:hypothetical protein
MRTHEAAERFRFSIEELHTEAETFTVIHPYEKDEYDIVGEAARLFYYGKSGWKEGWPLTFNVESVNGIHIARASVFILSAYPHFDVIPLKRKNEHPTRTNPNHNRWLWR